MSEWFEEFYAAVDAMDPVALAAWLTPNTRVQMGNHAPAQGREVVVDGLSGFWSTIAGMRHEFKLVIEDGDTACVEALVHYTRRDGATVAIPAVTMIRREDGLIADQRIYLDMAPLHGAAA